MSESLSTAFEPAPKEQFVAAVLAAWLAGSEAEVEAALGKWLAANGQVSVDYWVERCIADGCFENSSLRDHANKARLMARQNEDEIAQARIAASVADAQYTDWRPARDIQTWMSVLRGLSFERLAAFPDQLRLELSVGVLAADLYGEALVCAEETAQHILQWVNVSPAVPASLCVNALGYALEYYSAKRLWASTHAVVGKMEAIFEQGLVVDAARSRAHSRLAFYFYYRRGIYSRAYEHSERALKYATLGKVGAAAREALITATLCRLQQGDVEAAGRALEAEIAATPGGHLMMVANGHYERACWHALRRDVVSAQIALDTACRLFAEIDEHGIMSLATPSLQAQLFLQVGEHAQALRVFDLRLHRPDHWKIDVGFIEACAALASGRPQLALEPLRAALATASRLDMKGIFWGCREELQTLSRFALSSGIETEWVRECCRARQISLDS